MKTRRRKVVLCSLSNLLIFVPPQTVLRRAASDGHASSLPSPLLLFLPPSFPWSVSPRLSSSGIYYSGQRCKCVAFTFFKYRTCRHPVCSIVAKVAARPTHQCFIAAITYQPSPPHQDAYALCRPYAGNEICRSDTTCIDGRHRTTSLREWSSPTRA